MSRTFISDRRKRNILLSFLLVAIALLAATLAYAHASYTAKQGSGAEEPNGVSVLLSLADTAFHEQRIVAPAGSNMYEFYLSILALEPKNKLAKTRLLFEFEPASREIEHVISNGDLDEAERELRLLHDYSKQQQVESDNYKLALLGSYLYAQRNLLSRTHETEALQIQDRHAAAPAPPVAEVVAR